MRRDIATNAQTTGAVRSMLLRWSRRVSRPARPANPYSAMKAPAALTGPALQTYAAINGDSPATSLAWSEVRAFFRELTPVAERANGDLMVLRNGQTLLLHLALADEAVEAGQVLQLRELLVRSTIPLPANRPGDGDWMVVIDHREARIFHSIGNSVAKDSITPPAPHDYFRHEHNSKDFSRGKERPNPAVFLKPRVDAMHGAGRIVVFGNGKRMSNEVDQFIAWLKRHAASTAGRIVMTRVVDEYHLSDAQLFSLVRTRFSASPASQGATR